MEYIRGTTDFKFNNTAVTIGKFGGFHKGHKMLIDHLTKAGSEGLKPVLFTFEAPAIDIIQQYKSKNLLTNQEKLRIYMESGIKAVIEYPFNEDVMKMTAEVFIKDILVDQLGVKCIIAGDDFRFGNARAGDVELLKTLSERFGYRVEVFKKIKYKDQDISSTLIKHYVKTGDMDIVQRMLGYPYFVTGEILHGNRIGKTIGFPTMNMIADRDKLLPPDGVYKSRVCVNGVRYDSITNIGNKPTVGSDIKGIETHILKFNEDIYGETAVVELLEFIRPEQRFVSLEVLKRQIQADIERCYH